MPSGLRQQCHTNPIGLSILFNKQKSSKNVLNLGDEDNNELRTYSGNNINTLVRLQPTLKLGPLSSKEIDITVLGSAKRPYLEEIFSRSWYLNYSKRWVSQN